MHTYVFGYGSILNPTSMAKDISPKSFVKWTTITGYERIFDFAALEKREKGYSAVDITAAMTEPIDAEVYCFIGPNNKYPELSIPRDYFDMCVSAIPQTMQKEWLAETIVENPIA
jgi:hypothetical protein